MKCFFIFTVFLFYSKTNNAQINIKCLYDNDNRITKICYSDSSFIVYYYDASGNRVSRIVTSGANITPLYIASPICSGSAVNIPFSILGYFGSSNTFTAQLSDTAGSFANPIDIGSLVSSGSGTIAATIPINVLSDTRYKIRIISSSPKLNSNDNGTNLTINPCQFNIHSKLFIEGYYASNGAMTPVIDPLTYPNICDTIILKLHSPNSPFELLYSDTQVVQTDGTCVFDFLTSPEFGKYYLSLKHRNSIETWSNAPFSISDTNNWLISENPNLIYNNELKDLGDGHFALFSGDVDQNGVIDINDFIDIETGATLFLNGYLPEDLSGDWIIESSDFSLIENNLGKLVSRP